MLELLRYMQGTVMFRVHVYWKSFVHKIQKELEVPSRDVSPVVKHKKAFTLYQYTTICTRGAEHYQCNSQNIHKGHFQRSPGVQ